jgi:hypothetical protein
MSKFILAAGAAALAIAMPAMAGQGHGGGGHGGPKAGHEGKSGGHKGGHEGQGASMKGHGHSGGAVNVAKVEHGHGMKAVARIRDDDRGKRIATRDLDDDRFEPRFGQHGVGTGLIDGCPPGLAKKNNGCLPPGQAKKLVGAALPAGLAQSMLSGPYRDWYRDDDRFLYRMGDDYIYRINRDNNLISALIPSVDRDYSYYPVGQLYPSDFNYYNVPYQYQSYYPDGSNALYRYGDGAIYRLNRQTQAIQSIVALLAGDLGVGQALPLGYSAYNLPLQYRDRYFDTPENMYRYNDGYIYRVDPKTQLITAVINALV